MYNMNILCVLVFMILCHIIADYNLQGWLASAKQFEWWKKQDGYNDFYKNDYKMALFMHSLSWSIMIHLPIIVFYNFNINFYILLSIISNCLLHYVIDDAKANWKLINLVQDQILHLIQILIYWAILCVLCVA